MPCLHVFFALTVVRLRDVQQRSARHSKKDESKQDIFGRDPFIPFLICLKDCFCTLYNILQQWTPVFPYGWRKFIVGERGCQPYISALDPRFREWGHQPQWGHQPIIWHNFCRKLHDENNWAERRGAHPFCPQDPQLYFSKNLLRTRIKYLIY